MLAVIAILLGLLAYGAYSVYHRVTQALVIPGCQAGTGANAVALDFGQAADASTVAGVAVREHLPSRALTVAYATAFQESKLENLTYGDRDSVGIFQQRPSEGWGTTAQLEDPAYAAQAFFGALVKVPNYATIPVYEAAQAVQKSADGSAYQQYAPDRRAARGRLHLRAARGHLLVQPGAAGLEPGRLREAQPARGGGGTGPRVRHARGRRGADSSQPHPFGIG